MKRIRMAILSVVAILSLSSCNHESDLSSSSPAKHHMVTLHLAGCLEGYETTRSVSYQWEDGSKLYLQLYNGDSRINGQAVYSAKEDRWTMEYFGSIAIDQKSRCEVYYFENVESESVTEIMLSPNSAVYVDSLATYYSQGGDLYLHTTLNPCTGRMRVAGQEGRSFALYGLSYYASYKLDENRFTFSNPVIDKQIIGPNGYSPYIYAYLADTDNRQLVVETDDNSEFRREVSDNFLKAGLSGVIDMPTTQAHNGWKMYSTIEEYKVGNVSFNMIKVNAGTFVMEYDLSNVPSKETTIEKNYLLGETEVTQELWQAVMGTNPSKNQGLQHPVEWVSWQECLTFLDIISTLTGVQFRMPTQSEWQYAAKGGMKSQGYIYSGSNKVGDVAWYKGNSGNQTHDVKTKQPNELGFYDMSGNVFEFCKYVDNDLPDPPEKNIIKHCFGGSCDVAENRCYPYSDAYLVFALVTKSATVGLRLAASIK